MDTMDAERLTQSSVLSTQSYFVCFVSFVDE